MRRRTISLIFVIAAALATVLPVASAGARECVGVPGVFNYCPGRHCGQIQPCIEGPTGP